MKKFFALLSLTLLLCRGAASAGESGWHDEVKSAVAAEARIFPGTPGIFFQDLKTGKIVRMNACLSFPAASLIKLPILFEVFRENLDDKIRLDRKLSITREDQVGGSGILKNAPPGSKVTVLKAATLMIQESDNTATDMLIRLMGMEAVNGTLKSGRLDCPGTALKRTIWDFEAADRGRDNVTTPRDMASMLCLIERGSFPDKESCLAMKNILLGQKRSDLMTADLPPDIRVAHKTGELSGILHDCGIVYLPGRPYVLCLMGKDIGDMDEAREVWRRLSLKIYLVLKKADRK